MPTHTAHMMPTQTTCIAGSCPIPAQVLPLSSPQVQTVQLPSAAENSPRRNQENPAGFLHLRGCKLWLCSHFMLHPIRLWLRKGIFKIIARNWKKNIDGGAKHLVFVTWLQPAASSSHLRQTQNMFLTSLKPSDITNILRIRFNPDSLPLVSKRGGLLSFNCFQNEGEICGGVAWDDLPDYGPSLSMYLSERLLCSEKPTRHDLYLRSVSVEPRITHIMCVLPPFSKRGQI